MSDVEILYITYNRLHYTQQTLLPLLSNDAESFSVTIVDNASTDGTVAYLKQLKHSRIKQVIFNKENEGLSKPTREFWERAESPYVMKVDNDVLVPVHFVRTLLETACVSKHFGAIGGFHFHVNVDWRDEYTKYVSTHGRRRRGVADIAQFKHIGGAGYICRTSIARAFSSKLLTTRGVRGGWTTMQWYMHGGKYVNGYVYPLLQIQHLPDPIFGKSVEYDQEHLKQRFRDEACAYFREFGIEQLESHK